MDSGGNMQSNEEKSVEKAMDNYLKSMGLHRKKIAKDGSCLFRAVAEQVLHCQSLHTEVRSRCVEFLKQNRDSYEAFIEGNFEEYLFKLQDPQQWVGEVEINALAIIYKRDFQIFQEPGKPAVNITDNNFKDKVRLCFLNGNHYDSVYPVSRIKNSGLCQSILYELLYDGVFKVERGALAPCQRSSRPHDFLSDDVMYPCGSSDESEPDTGEPLWVQAETSAPASRSSSHGFRGRGRGRQLPERVRRSLNPTLLRNVQYDIWQKSKKAQHKMDYSIAAGMQFSVGDRCQVRLDSGGRSYNATIKGVPSTSGPVTVYVDELGTKQVPLWSLRPPNTENSWSTVVREKRLNNGHGDWEERGKGRGRVRSTPVSSSSSVSQTTAAGSGGRVQKQHSWPLQATAEEKGGGKPSRKSIDSEEAERLAKKEEEDLNAALVAIQLQDENSFPALGTQAVSPAEGGRRKSGEKRRSQRNKTKSPDEDVVLTPPAGEKLKSSTPPPRPPPATTSPVDPARPADRPADSVGRSSVKPVASGPAPTPPPTKANTQSYASAAASPTSPPNVKPSIPSSAGIFSFITPVLPAASTPPASSLSPPPSSSAPRPTFISPIAPCPTAPQGLLHSFSPVTTLPRSPSPPSSSSSSSAAPPQAPPATSVLPKPEASQRETLVSQSGPKVAPNLNHVSESREENPPELGLHEVQTQSQDLQNQNLTPQSQTEVLQSQTEVLQSQTEVLQSQTEVLQSQTEVRQSQTEVRQSQTEVRQSQTEVRQSQTEVLCEFQTQPQTEVVQVQSSEPPLDASQVPAVQTEAPPTPESPPPPPSGLPQLPSLPHPQPLPGNFPVLQLFHDPLYPGFPQGENGEVQQIPPFSTSRTGDDLPKDVNVLRFFFNLGVKAYTLPVVSPCLYLVPLQQFYTLQARAPAPAHSPAPHYPAASPPSRPPDAQPPTQYPPPSPSPHYDHHTPPVEPPYPTETPFPQPTYQGVTQPQRMPVPWQPLPLPRNPSYPVGYASPPPPFHGAPPPSSQGYHPGQGPVHPMYPSGGPQYPRYPLGYQPSSTPEELQVSQGVMEQLQPANGDSMLGHGLIRVLGPLDGPPAANMANADNNRTIMVTSNYAFDRKFLPAAMKKEGGESLTRTVLLVDPPLNNKPILAVVPDQDIKDASVSKATMNPGSIQGSPSNYRGHRKPHNPMKMYIPSVVPDPTQLGYPPALAMGESLSVACGTEDDFEGEGFAMNTSGQRRSYRGRGGRGRGGYDTGRGAPSRRYMGAGSNYVQFNSSYRGRGRERGY